MSLFLNEVVDEMRSDIDSSSYWEAKLKEEKELYKKNLFACDSDSARENQRDTFRSNFKLEIEETFAEDVEFFVHAWFDLDEPALKQKLLNGIFELVNEDFDFLVDLEKDWVDDWVGGTLETEKFFSFSELQENPHYVAGKWQLSLIPKASEILANEIVEKFDEEFELERFWKDAPSNELNETGKSR